MSLGRFGYQPAGAGPGTGGGAFVGAPSQRDRVKGAVFKGVLIFSLVIGFATLIVLLITVASDGLGHLSWDFVTSFPSSLPSRAGIQSPLVGTIYLMLLVAVITVPIGVGAALYLEEYADRRRWFNRAIELNIQNLAAVPSIVYGILGLRSSCGGRSGSAARSWPAHSRCRCSCCRS